MSINLATWKAHWEFRHSIREHDATVGASVGFGLGSVAGREFHGVAAVAGEFVRFLLEQRI